MFRFLPSEVISLKHAYLIVANNNFTVLKYALSMIDDPRNVVFLLIDKKTKNVNFGEFSKVLRESELIILPRINIYWGGFSQIEAELYLIEAAIKYDEEFSYYHYFQGADLPLKSQDEIHNFFDENYGSEFIGFKNDQYELSKYKANYYHFLVENRYYRTNKFIRIINHSLARMQRLLGIRRKGDMQFYNGAALFSITDEFAKYVIDNKAKIFKDYKFTLTCDEIFLQTLIMESPFKEKINAFEQTHQGNSRFIDFIRSEQRNSPHVFTMEDYEDLINADEGICFARKFSQDNIEVVKKLHCMITGKEDIEPYKELKQDERPSHYSGVRQGIYRRYFKKPMDFILSLAAIMVLSPLLLIIGLLVKIELGSPVIYKQERPGLNEKLFKMYKFRTMTDERDEEGKLLPDNIRLTKFGKFLRSTSLDELPELFNILKGNMSIIGPRPLLIQYLPLYDEEQKRRHEVKPGLSGLAQVNGRNSLSWEDRFNLDVEYVDNVSFIGDLKIIFLTIKKVLVREGISSQTDATMEAFMGNRKTNED